jgi:hypothetical protein
MKRQLISLTIILPLLSLFSSLEVYAQDGIPILAPEPTAPKLKPVSKKASRSKLPGLTTVEYNERYRQIYYAYTGSKASLDETVNSFEALVKQASDDTTRSITYQFLGLLYLHGRNDAVNAEAAMERAIRAKGSALVEISFDNKWRQMSKSRSGDYKFEDVSRGWIKIESGKLTFTDRTSKPLVNDKTEASLTGQQIKDLTKTVVAAFTLIEITTNNTRRPYIFAAGNMKQVEADLVIKLIQKHVMGKVTDQGKATAKGKATIQGKATAQVRR